MTHVHSEITPEALDRIHRALEDNDSPAPWIARSFEALAYAQGNAERAAVLEAALTRLDAIARVEPRNAIGEREFTEALQQSFIALHPNQGPAT